jgi:regulator of protease activity HflC (stomatin/prohibitin superfamily)
MKKYVFGGVVAGALLLLFILSGSIWETNDRGYVQVKQALWTGTMTCRTTPGTYLQLFGSIDTLAKADIYYFSKHKEEGGESFGAAPVLATFSGRSKADITGALKFELPLDCAKLKAISEKYSTNRRLKEELIRQYTTEVLTQTAPLFEAEEADAPKRDLFREIAMKQLKQGIFKKKNRIINVKDPSNPKKTISKSITELALDENGNPIIVEPSPFIEWGIRVISFNIKDLDWDDVTDRLLAKKKEIDMERTLAKAAAVTAQQDRIKEEEQGKARVAKAEANALVEKKTAVIEQEKLKEVAELEAKKKFEVAKFAALEAKQKAIKIKAEGEAKAYANKALVAAGLTPREKAEYQMRTAIGVAEQLANAKFPSIMTFGGGKGGPQNPLEAIGYNQMFDLVQKMAVKQVQ